MTTPEIDAYIEILKRKLPTPDTEVVKALAPSGILRAGINLSNFLLVTDKSENDAPEGVSPDIASAVASVIGCNVECITYPSPGAVADAAEENAWDIGNIGADPARASFINFTDAYCEIEATCLVPEGSMIKSFADVDQPGIKIATKQRAAYTLWLERNIKQAELVQFESTDGSFEGFVEQKLNVLAGLRPRLIEDAQNLSGSNMLLDKFFAVQQAIGTPNDRNPAGIEFLRQFVNEAKAAGLVQALIEKHGMTGKLSVAGG